MAIGRRAPPGARRSSRGCLTIALGPVSGQTRSRCSAGSSPCGCPPVMGVAHLRFAFPPVTVPARGSRGVCPALSSSARPASIDGDGGRRQVMARVFIGVDSHKLSATIEVVDDKETVLATGRFSTDKAGYAAMRRARRWVSRPCVGGGGQQRRRPAVGATAVGRWRARRGRAREAVGAGRGCSTRTPPQDRRPRRARRRGGRGAHPCPAGAAPTTCSWRRCDHRSRPLQPAP